MSRILGGQSKGKHLINAKNTRPTSGRARTALFSILEQDIPYAMFCDAFAGGGSIGIEALMRGSRTAIFIEIAHSAIKAIQENLKRTGFHHIERDQWQDTQGRTAIILHGDWFKIFRQELKFDPIEILFIDPPWNKVSVTSILQMLEKTTWLSNHCQTIIEHNSRIEIPSIEGFCITDHRKYGDTAFTILQKTDSIIPHSSKEF
ncbi:MAG: RsmD family RNA methyltransferase [bacterium]|nr:RsmD family RNA methyltransferase [bacterium]